MVKYTVVDVVKYHRGYGRKNIAVQSRLNIKGIVIASAPEKKTAMYFDRK